MYNETKVLYWNSIFIVWLLPILLFRKHVEPKGKRLGTMRCIQRLPIFPSYIFRNNQQFLTFALSLKIQKVVKEKEFLKETAIYLKLKEIVNR